MGGGNDNGIVSTITEGISNKLPSSKQNTKSPMLPRIQEIDDEKEDTDYTNGSNANKSIKSKPIKYDTFFESDEDIPPIKSSITKKSNSDLDHKNISKLQNNNYKSNSLPVAFDTNNQSSNHKNNGLDNALDTRSEIVKHLSVPTKHQRKSSFSETIKETISSQIENIEGNALNQISNIFGNSPFANNEVPFNNNGFHPNYDEIGNGINHVNLGGSSEENNENESSDD